MKTKLIAIAASATLLLSGCGLVGGGSDSIGEKDGDITKLTIGATPVPQGDILKFVDENLAEEAGLDIEVTEYTDYTLPNKALSDGDIDANYFQHKPYLDSEVEGQGYELTAFEPINLEPFALFSKDIKDVKDLPKGAKIGINNDPANQGRALKMLEEAKVITLKEGVDAVDAKLSDVEDNPKKVEFVEADAAQLARTLEDVDASVINGNNALEAGLSPAKDGILLESAKNNPYGNFLASRTENKDDENLKKLDELLHSPR
ncbi:MetQ/NlpA family ABC transporter substrate-binding protein [Brevibacterium aurantiacum]|uniref:MetQ/NlpA family ABC transporter substrate-binding protein n=1 Tax=Brevibacterium aurantiacum TaxID=273384 RepID=UPI001F49EC6E|nr:MetQ/NlpA family ABC transporter substrate-binding protein [Brevibacterium aurantiacum]